MPPEKHLVQLRGVGELGKAGTALDRRTGRLSSAYVPGCLCLDPALANISRVGSGRSKRLTRYALNFSMRWSGKPTYFWVHRHHLPEALGPQRCRRSTNARQQTRRDPVPRTLSQLGLAAVSKSTYIWQGRCSRPHPGLVPRLTPS